MTPTGRPRGPYAVAPIQREKILRGAVEYFGQYGYWGSSMREIATHIGMSQTSMRHYFGTKTELLTAVLDERDRVSEEALNRAMAETGTHLDALAQIVIDNVGQPNMVRLFTTLSAEATTADHPAHEFFAERYRRIAGSIARILDGAIASGEATRNLDTTEAARVALAVMFGLQVQWLLDPSVDMVKLFKNHVVHYFAGGRDAK